MKIFTHILYTIGEIKTGNARFHALFQFDFSTGVVRLHIKEGYFLPHLSGFPVTSPIWGPPPSGKQALTRLRSENILSFENVLFSTIRKY